MSVLDQLATALNRRDEVPNQELARHLAAKKDLKGVREIIDNLHNKDRNIQGDCIKVIDELAAIDPSLVSPYVKNLLPLLEHKNNRMQWGTMAALDEITAGKPGLIYPYLPEIISAADKGSVITKDRCVSLLIKLCASKKYAADAVDLLLEQLQRSFPNQLPMYAENTAAIIGEAHKSRFLKILLSRINDLEKDTQKKRIEKVIRRFS